MLQVAKKKHFLVGLLLLLILLITLSVSGTTAKYITKGTGLFSTSVSAWKAVVEGEVKLKGDSTFDYYQITAKPSESEVSTQVALQIENLPAGVNVIASKGEETIAVNYDSTRKLYILDDIIPVGSSDTFIYKVTFNGAVLTDTDIVVTPIIEQKI